ncbi:hypothetical protein GCM10012275_31810 [Longimycelium tulufanense]|uniref:Methyltransferase domain-containing protein n=1 Tax=Longimycelium tulufanense TaxID=907463 RepID=A0A8J3CDI2_9PSEU|nr:class I SAM-dependent methyltransferase [Longimycelium tulufanense]GGM58260.1 hypothetical protein GCM10012275_31810 [Longimycelium tulufanense]
MDDTLASVVADLAAWLRLAPLLTEYLPFPERALRPAAVASFLDEVLVGNRTVLLELGCGPSTVLLARLLDRRGFGRLLALEHDEKWAAFVDLQLRRESLHHLARVVHVPLAPHPAAVLNLPWYAPRPARDEVTAYVERFGLVDLLMVDGPDLRYGPTLPGLPAADPSSDLVRQPTLPVLRGALAPGATVLVDDADRPGTRALLGRWGEEYGLTFHINKSTGLAAAQLTP